MFGFPYLLRLATFLLVPLSLGWAASARADDYGGPDGYGRGPTSYELDVSHDGYGGAGRASESVEARTYVVVEAEEGTSQEVDGEPIIVVEEPEPIAATTQAPPSPKVVAVDEQVLECPSGVWVHGHWDYRGGQYVWVDGHCTVVRVNYVFVHPRWDFYSGIWWFIPGYYRPCGVYVGFGYYRPWYWFPPYFHPYYRGGRAVPVHRSVPLRPTVASPSPTSRARSVGRAPSPSPTVIHRAPSGATRARPLGRAGTGPTLTDMGSRPQPSIGIVSQPRINNRQSSSVRGPSSTPSIGVSRGRSRARPSRSGSGWRSSGSSGSSGSSRGWGGGRTNRAPSTGSSGSGRGSSGSPSSGGFGGSRSTPSPRGR